MKINLSQCCPLFSGISENEMDKLLSCLDARERRYQKGELVISAGTKISRFGVLLSGTVEIQQEDFQGNITIVAQITPGQLFAEAFGCRRCFTGGCSVHGAFRYSMAGL